MKICGVYKITNTITGDFYIGSSKDVKQRLACHKCKSTWNEQPNNSLYKDMQKYGLENFVFEVLVEVEPDSLKEAEQRFIETLKPTYNNYRAKGLNVARYKEYNKEYQQSDKYKETHRKANNKYYNQLCFYNGETITLSTLRMRFKSQGIDHYTAEAKKYLKNNNPIEFYDVYP